MTAAPTWSSAQQTEPRCSPAPVPVPASASAAASRLGATCCGSVCAWPALGPAGSQGTPALAQTPAATATGSARAFCVIWATSAFSLASLSFLGTRRRARWRSGMHCIISIVLAPPWAKCVVPVASQSNACAHTVVRRRCLPPSISTTCQFQSLGLELR